MVFMSLSEIQSRIQEIDREIEKLWSSYEIDSEAYDGKVRQIDPRRAIKQLLMVRAQLADIRREAKERI